MFDYLENSEFWAAVTVRLPGGAEKKFRARCALYTAADWDARLKQEMDAAEGDFDLARRRMIAWVMKSWEGVVGNDGSEVAFTASHLDALTAHTWFAAPVVEAYIREITGAPARKN